MAQEVIIKDAAPGGASLSVVGNTAFGSSVQVTDGSITAQTSLAAVTTGNGATVDFGSAQTYFQGVIVASAGVGAGACQMQVSLDGTNWVTYGAVVTTAAPGSFAVPATPIATAARYARLVVTTTVTGGTVSGSVMVS